MINKDYKELFWFINIQGNLCIFGKKENKKFFKSEEITKIFLKPTQI